ncbi:hypothetical protein BD410DRAFT_866637 [Rickenella mellea]|uniref:Uncharacterized protein n=1 Tax=Rickenella mellea TaxID=50990 RepID=A0A4Y7Q1W4_9AGAM|nr:hypothetical protein BD410DRAFT_866637 [Rickenella mellea]
MSTLFRPGRTTTNPRAGLELFFIPLFVLERDEGSGTEWGVGQVEDSENWTASGRWMLLLRRVSYRQTRISQALVFVISIYVLQPLGVLSSLKRVDTHAPSGPGSSSTPKPQRLALRIPALLPRLCSFLAFPVVNTIVLHYIFIFVSMMSIVALSPSAIVFLFLKRSSSSSSMHVHVSTVLTIQLAFITLAARSHADLDDHRDGTREQRGSGGGTWTFGQTVALANGVLPIRDVTIQTRAMAGASVTKTILPSLPYLIHHIHNHNQARPSTTVTGAVLTYTLRIRRLLASWRTTTSDHVVRTRRRNP